MSGDLMSGGKNMRKSNAMLMIYLIYVLAFLSGNLMGITFDLQYKIVNFMLGGFLFLLGYVYGIVVIKFIRMKGGTRKHGIRRNQSNRLDL